MDPWHQFWMQFFFQLSSILPWFAAGAAAVIAVSLTPMGRALTRYLRDARSRSLPPEALQELTALRSDVAEVLERLDFLERALAQQRLTPGPGQIPEIQPPRLAGGPEQEGSRIPTPV
jgi:hypothetical protein